MFNHKIKFELSFSITIMVILVLSTNVFGQKKDHDLDSLQSVVVKSFHPIIAKSEKIAINPVYGDSMPKLKLSPYIILSHQIPTTFDLIPIKPATIQSEPLQRLYPAFFKLGLSFPYNIVNAEGYYNSLRSKDYYYGLDFKSLTSESTMNAHGYSGYSDNKLECYGKRFFQFATLAANFEYVRNVVHYYGYDVNKFKNPNSDSLIQRYNYIAPSINFKSTRLDSTHFNYDGTFKYYNLTDAFGANENRVNADIKFNTFYDKQNIGIKGEVDYLNDRFNHDTTNNLVAKVEPEANFRGLKWQSRIALPLEGEFAKKNSFYLFPSIDFNYQLVDQLFFADLGVGGDVYQNSLKSLSEINPFVSNGIKSSTTSFHEEYIGILGQIDQHIYVKLRAKFLQFNGLPFYTLNDKVSMQNQFLVVYDDGTQFNTHAEVGYNYNSKIELMMKVDYFHYSLNTLPRPWYKPEIQVTTSFIYHLKDKIRMYSDVFYIGKQYAIAGQLPGMVDLNLGVDYRYSKLFSLYVELNNMANYKYQRWYNYPSQGIWFLGGLKVTI